MTQTGKVLVLGGDTRAFLAVVRSLGRQGVEVHVGWCPESSPARHSRYVARLHHLPPVTPGGEEWKHALVRLIERERYDLVIPCDDPTSVPLSVHREAFEPLHCVYLLSPYAFEVTSNKIRSYRLAASLGVPVPASIVIEGDVDPRHIISTLPLPVIVKPPSTFVPQDLVNRNAVRVARSVEHLAAALRSAAGSGGALVQEHVAGVGAGVEVLAHRGDVLVAFQHERVHEPSGGGGSSYRKSVPLDPRLRDAAAALMRALEYTGVAMVEFKINPRRGTWAFMEINGRFWGSLPLAVAAGVDFPYYLFEMLVRGRRDFPQQYRTGLYARNIWLDAVWMLQNARVDRRDATLISVPWSRVAGEVINVFALRERLDTLVADDPVPALVELAQLSRAMGAKVSALAKSVALRLPPVWQLHRARARRALSAAHSILFVCKGNICRSPFAEAYVRQYLSPTVRVSSSGYYPRAGRRSPDEAIAAASAAGVDLMGHRSRLVSEEAVGDAEAIFVFDVHDLQAVRHRYPASRPKAFLLGALSSDGMVAISDPYGKGRGEFDTVYRTIASILDSALGPAHGRKAVGVGHQ